MENNNKLNIGERIKAVAITFIGAGIFSQGTFYFKKQASYNVPRILYPIFELLGNVGLAVAMVILGLGLAYWGFTKWKNTSGKAGVFGLIAVASFAVFFSILFFTGKKATPEELAQKSEERRAKGIEQIQSAEQPDFDNPEIDAHFAAFEKLLTEYKTAYKNENKHEIIAKESAYLEWNKNSADLIQKLSSSEEKQQFGLYLANLSIKWQEVK
ncbi:hypothetical protein [Pedobacter agri]|uniref:hypothetical protein n=1 Tax=Pedobacter agri TaxID=454586 RepID=UPI00292EAD88|nr:hypothetical protein [Pedobacter agri]